MPKSRALVLERLEARHALSTLLVVPAHEGQGHSQEAVLLEAESVLARKFLASDSCRPPYTLPLTLQGGRRPALDARGCRTNVYPQFNAAEDTVTYRLSSSETCGHPLLAFGLKRAANCSGRIVSTGIRFNQRDFLASTAPRDTAVDPLPLQSLKTQDVAATDEVFSLSINSPLHPSKRGRYARQSRL